MKLLKGFAVLSLCMLIGSALKHQLPVPIPEAIYGMGVLLILLSVKAVKVEDVEPASEGLLSYLTFFFLPAGVGLLKYLDVLRSTLIPMLLMLAVSCAITMAVTAKVTDFFLNRGASHAE